MITLENAVAKLLSDDVIIQTYVYSYKSRKFWKIINPITIQLSTGKIINIPSGFYYDMASVPKWLWSVTRPFNDGLLGTLIHDYLYIHKEKHTMNRAQVDNEYLKWMNVTNKNKLDNYTRYTIVRLFGWLVWHKLI